MNARDYTVEERLEERMGLHSRGTRGFAQSRNAWVYTVEYTRGI